MILYILLKDVLCQTHTVAIKNQSTATHGNKKKGKNWSSMSESKLVSEPNERGGLPIKHIIYDMFKFSSFEILSLIYWHH